jgi:hypothetical protein
MFQLKFKESFEVEKREQHKNVLVAITFDLKFIYVLAWWEGSAHNPWVLGDALSRPSGLKIPECIN